MSDQVLNLEALGQALAPYLTAQKSYVPHGLHPAGLPMGFKADGTPAENVYLYEQGGLFGRCDGPNTLINALVGPIGLEKELRWTGIDTEQKITDAWTSISESGDEQSTACGDCITPALQMCGQNYCLGRFCRQTQEMQFDRIGVRANENVGVRNLFGSITSADGTVLVRQGEEISDGYLLQIAMASYFLRLRNATLLWTGNSANNANRVNVQYNGLQVIVNTGKFDLWTQQTCDGLDSFLLDYQNNTPQSDGALAITNFFRRMVLQFMNRAGGAGLDWNSAEMKIVMTPNMWDCITRAYACSGIDLCSLNRSVANMNQDAGQAQERMESFLERMALPIYGRWYPVVLDSQIPETPGQANGVCSDIYFLTTRINGRDVLFGQYQDFNKTYGRTRQELLRLFKSDDIAITDNGRFALVKDNERGCFDVQIITKPRLVAMMPFLLGRLQNVCCDILGSPLPDPSGSGEVYVVDGGRTTSPIPTLYGC